MAMDGKERAALMLADAEIALEAARGTRTECAAWERWLHAQRYWMSCLTTDEINAYARSLAATVKEKRGNGNVRESRREPFVAR